MYRPCCAASKSSTASSPRRRPSCLGSLVEVLPSPRRRGLSEAAGTREGYPTRRHGRSRVGPLGQQRHVRRWHFAGQRRHAVRWKFAGRDIRGGPSNHHQSRHDCTYANDDRRAAALGHFHFADHHWPDGRVDTRCALVTEAGRKGNPPATPASDAEQLSVPVVPRMPGATGDPHGAREQQ